MCAWWDALSIVHIRHFCRGPDTGRRQQILQHGIEPNPRRMSKLHEAKFSEILLRARKAPEFSHGLDPKQTCGGVGLRILGEYPARKDGHSGLILKNLITFAHF